jgi:HSP20 family molecular chaperone IbpA
MLPTQVDTGKVHATYRDGLLELRLPKHEAPKPKLCVHRFISLLVT